MALSIEKQVQDNRVILVLDGELDVQTSPLLREQLHQLLEEGQRQIVLDMSKLSYMDSSGISALVNTHKALGAKGSLSLVACRPAVERVLRFTQFDKVLALYRNFEDMEKGYRENLRAVSGVSKSVIQKQKEMARVVPRRSAEPVPPGEHPGRRLQ